VDMEDDETDSDQEARISITANGAKLMNGNALLEKERQDIKRKKAAELKLKKSVMLSKRGGKSASSFSSSRSIAWLRTAEPARSSASSVLPWALQTSKGCFAARGTPPS